MCWTRPWSNIKHSMNLHKDDASPMVVKTVEEKNTAFSTVHFADTSGLITLVAGSPATMASRSIFSYSSSFDSIWGSVKFPVLIIVANKFRRPAPKVSLKRASRDTSAGYSKRRKIWRQNDAKVSIQETKLSAVA